MTFGLYVVEIHHITGYNCQEFYLLSSIKRENILLLNFQAQEILSPQNQESRRPLVKLVSRPTVTEFDMDIVLDFLHLLTMFGYHDITQKLLRSTFLK